MKKLIFQLSLIAMLFSCSEADDSTDNLTGGDDNTENQDGSDDSDDSGDTEETLTYQEYNDKLSQTSYDKPCLPPDGYGELVEELSDEFNGTELDTTKWRTGGNGGWTGRGARFMDDNVSVQDGYMQLKSSIIGTDAQLKDLYRYVELVFVNDSSKWLGSQLDISTWTPAYYGDSWYSNWSDARYDAIQEMGLDVLGAASVISQNMGTKGYYEARIRVSNITLSSSFWMQGKSTIEYDITESVGSYNVASSSTQSSLEQDRRKLSTHVWINTTDLKGKGGVDPKEYYTEDPLTDQYIVLGLKWEDELLTVYLNDEAIYYIPLVGLVTDTDEIPIPVETFTSPQYVIFDTEVLLAPSTGWPTRDELLDPTRNIYYIDWVRVWSPLE